MVQGSKCSYNTCQAKAHEHAGMGVIGGLGLVVHHPGTGQPTLPWSKPDACIANKGCSVLSGKQSNHPHVSTWLSCQLTRLQHAMPRPQLPAVISCCQPVLALCTVTLKYRKVYIPVYV